MSVVIAQSSSPSASTAERLDSLAQVCLGAVLQSLLDHEVDVRLTADLRAAGDVEDVLLRVDGGDLAAELLEALDDAAAGLAMAGVVGGGEARGPGADDRDVDHGVLAHRAQARGSRLGDLPVPRRARRGHDALTAPREERTAARPRATHHRDRGAPRGLDRRELRRPTGGADATRVPRPRHVPGRGRPGWHPVRQLHAGPRRGRGGADDHPARRRAPGESARRWCARSARPGCSRPSACW